MYVYGAYNNVMCVRVFVCVCVRVRSGAHTRKSVSAVLTYEIFTFGVDRMGCRRHSTMRRRSTRTLAHGTPHPSRRCPMYAGSALCGTDMRLVGVRYGAAVCVATPPMRARACLRACVCGNMRDLKQCPYRYVYGAHTNVICMLVLVCVCLGANTRKPVFAVNLRNLLVGVDRAWSAGRRSTMRRRSTRTSARGTPRAS
jgi:hypothetical protein